MVVLSSWTNEFFFQCRSFLKFRRPHYREKGAHLNLTQLEAELVESYEMRPWMLELSPLQFQRNLATLWILSSFKSWEKIINLKAMDVLEVGCQDFSRLPALKTFFKKQGVQAKITGIEVDAFPILSDFHSRWDRAQYYRQLVGFEHDYVVADFFKYQKSARGIVCFFPFVSEHPALRWGLPARFADGQKWLRSFLKCLAPHGFLFVVHQGEGEQEVFDELRAPFLKDLVLVERHQLSCPFLPPKIPSFVSLYQRCGEDRLFDN